MTAIAQTQPSPARRQTATGLVRLASWSVSDQILVSGSNFIATVILARALGPSSFGAFTLAYSVLLFFLSVQGAAFTQPHNVLGAGRSGSDYVQYTTETASAQTLFALGAGSTLALLALGAHVVGIGPAGLLLALAAALVAWQLQEFARRVLYTHARAKLAFASDLVNYGLQAVILVYLAAAGSVTPVRAMYTIAGTSALAAAWSLWLLRDDLSLRFVRPRIRENWDYGRWLLGGTLLYWAWAQIYLLLAAAFLGVAAVGVVRAAQNLLAATHVIRIAFETAALPVAARGFAEHGTDWLTRFLKRWTIVAAVPLVAYCALASGFAHFLMTTIYSQAYGTSTALLWLFSLAYVITFGAESVSIGLRAMRRSSAIFFAEIHAVMATVVAGPFLIWRFGIVGVALGLVVTVTALTYSLCGELRKQTVAT